GRLDLVTKTTSPSSANEVCLLLGLGDGTFAPEQHFAVGAGYGRLLTGDFNRDGRLDVASINVLQDPKTFKTLPGPVSVLLGRADGTFAPARRSPVAADNAPLLSGDFNGDGRLDLATIYGRDSADSGVVVLLGLGDGSFAPAQRFAAEGYGWYLVSGDF